MWFWSKFVIDAVTTCVFYKATNMVHLAREQLVYLLVEKFLFSDNINFV